MTTSDETVFDRVADIVVARAGDGAEKRAVVHLILGAPGGKQIRCPLTVKAALSLHAMLSSRLNILVSDTAGQADD